MNYDVAVIGAGVIGSLIARELSRYNLSLALVEKCNDTAMGTSKAMMEKVVVAKSRTTNKTKICCTRYGNVM